MCQHWPTTSCWVTLNMSLWECVSLRARLTLGGPIIVPFQRVSVMSSSSSRPQLQVPSPIPFWPSSSSSRSRKFRGTFTPGEVIETHTYQLWTGHLCSDKRASRQIQNEAQGILRSEGVPFGLFALKKKRENQDLDCLKVVFWRLKTAESSFSSLFLPPEVFCLPMWLSSPLATVMHYSE